VPNTAAGGAVASSMAVSGSTTYAVGESFSAPQAPDTMIVNTPCYWTNSTYTALSMPSGTDNGYANDVAVSGNAIYIAGVTGDSNNTPCYWLNGTYTALPIPSGATGGWTNDITISGDAVYIAGNSSSPCYWLNGVYAPLSLPSSAAGGAAFQVAVSGTTVYVVGATNTSSGVYTPCYWVNGIYIPLSIPSSATGGGQACSIALVGNNIYIGGQTQAPIMPPWVNTPCYWLNGTYTTISLPSSAADGGWVNDVRNVGGVIYINGAVVTGTSTITTTTSTGTTTSTISLDLPCYWANGTYTALPIPSTATTGNSIIAANIRARNRSNLSTPLGVLH